LEPRGPVRKANAQTTTGAKAVVLAVTGDESHNSDVYRTALTATLVQDAGIPIDFTDEEKLITHENLQGYKILILFRNGTWPKASRGGFRKAGRCGRGITTAGSH